ncbi:hypothetical protein DL770_001980 [Monosporascus sp. CRB-9-2]|nr:hypothetical protein DL770_001980 [Monosporascus sp. CRB-9-2]
MSVPPGVDLCQFPALPPPDGVTSNFTDPSPSLESTLIGITSVMTAAGAMFVAGRVYANWRRLHISDYCAIVALVFDGALSAIVLASMSEFPFRVVREGLTFVVQLIMPLSHSFSKAAILLLLLQIFTVDKKMRIAIYVGLAFTVLAYWPNLILVPIFSVPYAGETWDGMVTNPRVHKMTPVGTEQGVLAVLLDLYIFVLPMPILASLNMNTTKRLHLIGVFGTALAIVEVYVALIVACMPAFAQFIRTHIFGSVTFKSMSSRLIYYARGSPNSSQKTSNALLSGPQERSDGSRGPGPWWKPTSRRAGRKDGSSPENSAGFHGRIYYELNDSAKLNPVPVQTENHVFASPGIHPWNSNEAEPGIAITRTYGFDKTYHHNGSQPTM